MTLKQFVANCGTQRKAAIKLGIPLLTVSRWLRGCAKPSPMAVWFLRGKGIEV